jgi:diadenosine tetraphosphate (Ap4A) HIT family hydrolase
MNGVLIVMDASRLIARALKRLFNPDGIRIVQSGGAFSDLGHYHMHVFPSYKGDGYVWPEPLRRDGAEKRLAETREKLVRVLGEVLDEIR